MTKNTPLGLFLVPHVRVTRYKRGREFGVVGDHSVQHGSAPISLGPVQQLRTSLPQTRKCRNLRKGSTGHIKSNPVLVIILGFVV